MLNKIVPILLMILLIVQIIMVLYMLITAIKRDREDKEFWDGIHRDIEEATMKYMNGLECMIDSTEGEQDEDLQ